jgi:major vault protein
MESSTIRILPYEYIHILDKNKTVTRIEIGPMTYVRLDHEKIESGPTPKKMIILSPQTYCKVNNPVIRDNEGKIVQDKFGQSKLKYGESEYRFYENFQEPFPLYPGEELAEAPTDLKIIQENKALRVRATRDFNDGSKDIGAGDEWLVEGPQIYYPRSRGDHPQGGVRPYRVHWTGTQAQGLPGPHRQERRGEEKRRGVADQSSWTIHARSLRGVEADSDSHSVD